MSPSVRVDAGILTRKPYRAPQGHLRVDCDATRVGVFRYYNADGTYRDELRHPDQVFDPRSLATLGGAPVTLLHPPELATPDNFGKYGAGTVGDDVDAVNPYVRVTLNIQRRDAQEAIEQGVREVSLGYLTDSVPEVGEWEGHSYTHRQVGVLHKDGHRFIEYNHLAIVPAGRAGSNVRVHFDGVDDLAVSVPTTKNKPMSTLRIDEHQSFETDPAVAAAVSARFTRDAATIAEIQDRVNKMLTMLAKAGFESIDDAVKAISEMKAMLEQVTGENTALKAEGDQAKKEVDEVKGALEMAKADAANIGPLVRARIDLERTAERLVPATTKLDSLSDREVRMAVIGTKYPDLKLDGLSDDALLGMWTVATRSDSTAPLRQAAATAEAPAPQRADSTAEDARLKMIARRQKRSA